ncbi:Proton-dependent oligopeptide transporter family [Cinnamomum micranthum f. kanehirae]|uniref:Proton-dependent oligopeptide transporter family n=1 Tax=Cinnamomum micranthum f. kanehirae TaxID=337451 RepID=A0A443NRH8_9MAGN|nr:Proton-dependent oligopeptide transporter family [Cinnamomum micranthum f. kanehirae]
MAISESEPLLQDDTVDGAVDYKGNPVTRSTTGGWRSASFIIGMFYKHIRSQILAFHFSFSNDCHNFFFGEPGVEIAERFAYYGISSNMITYLTGPLHESTAAAAINVNTWLGVASMLPLLGAFVADSYLGRYRTIFFSSLLYVLGLGLLTLSATLPSLRPPDCENNTSVCPSPTQFQVGFFFLSLYLVALAQGGHKPNVQAFGADQFDPSDPEENKSKSSFFNWWYFGMCGGTVISLWLLNYIQDNLSWGLGFGVPSISMMVALVVFLLGTKTYRYCLKKGKNPFVSILEVFVAAARNRQGPSSTTDKESLLPTDYEATEVPVHGSSTQFKFLDRAAAPKNLDSPKNSWSVCSMSQVEDAKMVLQLVPVWVTCLIYGVVFAQSTTFFTKQGSTMERGMGFGFQIPPATLQTFISLSVVAVIPIYDWIFVPATRAFTGLPSGVTLLQRIGIGLFLSVISMVVAAIVEAQRLVVARDAGLIDKPTETVPMSVWWLLPQYILFGLSDVFAMVGLQEFFYDQVPDGMRSVGLALYLSIFGVGSFISGFLISVIEMVTTKDNGESWFSNNLNRAHLDYFYWLVAGLSAIELGLFLYFSKSHIYKNQRRNVLSM